MHDPTARKRILRIANKDMLQVNVSSVEVDNGLFGECEHALPSCDTFITIEIVTSARIFYFVVRNSERRQWLDAIGAVVRYDHSLVREHI